MPSLTKHRTIFSIIIGLIILVVAIGAIFWARGFKPNFKKGTIDRTGLLVVSSIPTGAEVYLDSRLTSATDTSIAFLEPKNYQLRIEKDGSTSWKKEITITADLSTEIKALLFPQAPEIKPLTTTGASNPILSPDGSNIVYATGGDRGGLMILPMSDRPFPFRQNNRMLAKNQPAFDYTTSKVIWGPDSKQLIARFETTDGKTLANLLIESDKSEQEPRDITGSLNATLNSWQDELIVKNQTLALVAPDSVKNATQAALPADKAGGQAAEAKTVNSSQLTVDSKKPTASPSSVNSEPSTVNLLNYYPTGLNFSPDEEKIFYKNKEEKYVVYDLKLKKEFILPEFGNLMNISWYPDSAHLVVAQKDLISIIETDGTNKMTVFSGKYENAAPASPNGSAFGGQGFVFAHPSGTRIIILTTLTQTEGNPPNLYAVNLR